MTASPAERALGTGREANLTGRDSPAALRPRSGTGAVARPRGGPGRGGGAVLAQAGRDGGDAGGGGGAGGGADTGAVAAVFVNIKPTGCVRAGQTSTVVSHPTG